MPRPKAEIKKEKQLNLRLTEEELETIDYVAAALKVNRSQAIIATMEERADEIYRAELKKNEKK